jgi:hypothetical protein
MSNLAILEAFAANLTEAITKFIAAVISESSAMAPFYKKDFYRRKSISYFKSN